MLCILFLYILLGHNLHNRLPYVGTNALKVDALNLYSLDIASMVIVCYIIDKGAVPISYIILFLMKLICVCVCVCGNSCLLHVCPSYIIHPCLWRHLASLPFYLVRHTLQCVSHLKIISLHLTHHTFHLRGLSSPHPSHPLPSHSPTTFPHHISLIHHCSSITSCPLLDKVFKVKLFLCVLLLGTTV